MADNVRFNVQKLNSDNFSTWSYKLKLLLLKDGLWDVVNTVAPTPVDSVWTKKDESAQVVIGLTVEDSQLRFIKNASTAREAWLALQSYHQKSTTSNKVHILKRLCRTFLKEGGDMEEHIMILSDYFDKLTGLGMVLPDDVIACLYLSNLPESYGTLVTALESRPEKDLTSKFIKSRLIDGNKKRKGAREVRESVGRETAMIAEHKANSSGAQGTKRSCFFCKKQGHMKMNCEKYKACKAKQEKSNKVSEESRKKSDYAYLARALLNTCSEECQEPRKTECSWIVDSGATSHMVQTRDFFNKIDPSKKGSVSLADETKAAIEGKGSGAIKCSIGDKKFSELEISDVLLVPGLGTNLLSVRKMTNDGYELIFKEDKCSVVKNGEVKAIARAPLP